MGATIVVRAGEDYLQNTFHTANGKLDRLLSQQIKDYKIKDPPTKRQVPISLRQIRRMLEKAKMRRQKFLVNLVVGAFFSACRSFEYTQTSGD